MEVRFAKFLGRTSRYCYFQDLITGTGFITDLEDGAIFQLDSPILPVFIVKRYRRIPRISIFGEYTPIQFEITSAVGIERPNAPHSSAIKYDMDQISPYPGSDLYIQSLETFLQQGQEEQFRQALAKKPYITRRDERLLERINSFYRNQNQQILASYRKKWQILVEFITHKLQRGELTPYYISTTLRTSRRGGRRISCLSLQYARNALSRGSQWILTRMGFQSSSKVWRLRGIIPMALQYPALRTLLTNTPYNDQGDSTLREAFELAKNWWELT